LTAATVSMLSARHARLSGEFSGILGFATLFLIDAVACALAFDLPELMDAQADWLRELLPPRAVNPALLLEHLSAFEQAAGGILNKVTHAQARALLARMRESIGQSSCPA